MLKTDGNPDIITMLLAQLSFGEITKEEFTEQLIIYGKIRNEKLKEVNHNV